MSKTYLLIVLTIPFKNVKRELTSWRWEKILHIPKYIHYYALKEIVWFAFNLLNVFTGLSIYQKISVSPLKCKLVKMLQTFSTHTQQHTWDTQFNLNPKLAYNQYWVYKIWDIIPKPYFNIKIIWNVIGLKGHLHYICWNKMHRLIIDCRLP